LKGRSEGHLQSSEVDAERVDVEGRRAAVDYDEQVFLPVNIEQIPAMCPLETKVPRCEPGPREQMEIAVG
jgi:hypothetical protein